jgi:hypothetical protein
MSDTAIADAPAEPVPPAPEAAAELEAARPDAEATVPAEAPADASVLPEIEHPIGPIRQAILDHLLDSEGPQTVAQFIAALGNFSRGPVETALKREYDAGRIERIAPGTYVLAPPKPPESHPSGRLLHHRQQVWQRLPSSVP